MKMSYWRDLIGRIKGSVKGNFLPYTYLALIVIGMIIGFGVQTYVCIFLCSLLPLPASLEALIGIALAVFLLISEILLLGDYSDFRDKQRKRHWRERGDGTIQ